MEKVRWRSLSDGSHFLACSGNLNHVILFRRGLIAAIRWSDNRNGRVAAPARFQVTALFNVTE